MIDIICIYSLLIEIIYIVQQIQLLFIIIILVFPHVNHLIFIIDRLIIQIIRN